MSAGRNAEIHHIPVLANEVLEFLNVKPGGLYLDATVGGGGHARKILEADAHSRVIAVDRDSRAIEAAAAALHNYEERVELVHEDFRSLSAILKGKRIDGAVADLGASSLQLDNPRAGFSFRLDGPLDMRMDLRRNLTACQLVNNLEEKELTRLIRNYGEESRAGKIAAAIVAARSSSPIVTTGDLANVVRKAIGAGAQRKRKIDPATRTFQALRIAVNDELEGLDKFISAAASSLKPGGRMAVISFHSLEDRIVKQTFRELAGKTAVDPRIPEPISEPPILKILTSKPIRPGAEEVERNPRCRSARLRVGERLKEEI